MHTLPARCPVQIKTMSNKLLILILTAMLFSMSKTYGQAVELKIDTVKVPCNTSGNLRVPVRVAHFTNVGSFQFSIGWSPSQLQYQYITKGAASNPFFAAGVNASFDTLTFLPAGKFSFQWNKVGGLSVPDTTVLFYVSFKRLGGPLSGVNFLSGTAAPLQVEVTDPNADDLPFLLRMGGVNPVDNQPPLITCPLNVNKTVSSPSVVDGIAPGSVSDNCSTVQVGWNATGATSASGPNDPDASGTVFNPGVTTVVYRATDIAGMTATCSFTIDLQPSATSDTLTISAAGGSVSCGQSVGISITALNFDSLGSLQFTVTWNKNDLFFNNITTVGSALSLSPTNFDTTNSRNKGYLTFFWGTGALAGTTIPDGSLLFRINFTPKSGNLANSLIQFTDNPVVREAYTNAVQPPEEVPVVFIPGQISATDNVPPVITCPPNQTVTTQSGSITANITNTAPTTLSDNCGGTVGLQYSRTGTTPGQGTGNANGTYNAGVTVVTYTAADASGNSASCSFNIVVDAGKAVTVKIDSVVAPCGTTTAVFPIRVRDFADIIGMSFSIKWDTSVLVFDTIQQLYPGFSFTPLNFQFFNSTPAGTLQFLAADPIAGWPDIPDGGIFFALKFEVKKSANTSSISFTGASEAVNSALNLVPMDLQNGAFVGGLDADPPQFTFCPPNQTVSTSAPNCEAVVILPEAIATDACSGIKNIVSNQTDSIFVAGNTTVMYTAFDNAGNSTACTFSVQVFGDPNLSQFLDCPTNIQVEAPSGVCSTPATWKEPTLSNPCGLVSPQIISNFKPGNSFPLGITPVVYELVGTSVTCNFAVIVRDITAPTLICPANLTVSASQDSCGAFVNWGPADVSDDCDASIAPVSDPVSGTFFTAGSHTVVFTATDDSNNSGTCSFSIQVNENVPPVLHDCPVSIIIELPEAKCDTAVTWTAPTATDNCAVQSLQVTTAPGTVFTPGTELIEYKATDVSGNTAICSFEVIVRDVVAPVITDCPADIFINLPENKCDTMVNWPEPKATDNCLLDSLNTNTLPGAIFLPGVYTVEYTAKDVSGNSTTCSFDISVRDDFAPTFVDCPTDLTVNLPQAKCDTALVWPEPVATDNCGIDSLLFNTAPGTVLTPGRYTIEYTAKDKSGNSTVCSFFIEVSDGFAPTISGCPGNIIIELPQTKCDTAINWTPPTATDNCALDSLNSTHAPGSKFTPGQTIIVYTAKDKSGNTATCSFTATVIDQVPPKFSSCPKDTMLTGVGTCGVIYSWILPDATDNCTPQPQIVITPSHPTVDTFYGNTKIVILAKDASNNYDTCMFTVKVTSSGVPGFQNVPQDLSFTGCTAVATWTPPTPTGFCTPPTLSATHMPGDTFQPGMTTVIYTATDQLGVTYTASFKVTVNELEKPTIDCPKGMVIMNAAGGILQDSSGFVMETDTASSCMAVRVEYRLPGAVDNCGTPDLKLIKGKLSGGLFPIGTDTLRFEAKDAAGNTSICEVHVVVKPLDELKITVSPVPACQGDNVILKVDSFLTAGVTYAWTGPQNITYPNAPSITVFQLNQGNAGSYAVEATINGCKTPKVSGEVQLVQKPNAVDDVDFQIDPGATDTFDVFTNDQFFPASDIKISQIGSNLPPGVRYLVDGKFEYTANPTGEPASFIYEICSITCPNLCDMATVTIAVRQVDCTEVPNVITPNGDDSNDFLQIKCLDSGLYPQNSIVIYNKWGDKVFEASPYPNDAVSGWKGTLNGEDGKDLPDDTYYYIFKPAPDKAPLKGFVQIYR